MKIDCVIPKQREHPKKARKWKILENASNESIWASGLELQKRQNEIEMEIRM